MEGNKIKILNLYAGIGGNRKLWDELGDFEITAVEHNPEIALYQEIIFLKHWFKGKWCVENVISYYDPLVPPIESNSHYFWCNFPFPSMPNYVRGIKRKDEEDFAREKVVGFDLSKYKFPTKRHRRTLINNCVEPEVGKHILNCALNK